MGQNEIENQKSPYQLESDRKEDQIFEFNFAEVTHERIKFFNIEYVSKSHKEIQRII